MPTWEDTTPYTDRETRFHRLTCFNVLIGLNVLGFLLSGILPRVLGVDPEPLAFEARHAIGKLWLWQFATYSFLQWVDIGFLFWFVLCVYTLYTMGNELEGEIGGRRCLVCYLSFAAYGALAHGLYQYAGGATVSTLGLFGPVYGIAVMGALRHPARPVRFFFIIPMRLATCVTLTGIACVFYCLYYLKAGLSPFSILGSAGAALAIARLEPPLDRFLDRLSSRREREQMMEESEVRREVDRILEKISREGMGNLTRAERKLLQKASEMASRRRGEP